ncbi:hypothetical protein B9T31_05985 [Acinetobacter sp. ANC 4558]|uniref:hypothetical protein n=1 Tax=Acinetobacter sp. ANC 4558 TaxID=1977876 RepID=UPI000A348F23|nr:hypothetical protein [Acinetobacter sp. ANC 4558]OTG87155.1 hypothetical protein B9T31_05985 [Acinetobacter sp. ANC 4558]
MNKKLLILGAIATGLLLTACVKKESPTEHEPEQTQAVSEPTEFHSLEATPSEETTPTQVVIETTEVQVVTPEIRHTETPAVTQPATQYNNVESVTPPPSKPMPVENKPVENKPAQIQQQPAKASNNNAQSEDDAVAAAIAAATPALKN